MTEQDRKQIEDELHQEFSRKVAMAVGEIVKQCAPDGPLPFAVAEGAVKGALAALMYSGASANEAAEVLEDIAKSLRESPTFQGKPRNVN